MQAVFHYLAVNQEVTVSVFFSPGKIAEEYLGYIIFIAFAGEPEHCHVRAGKCMHARTHAPSHFSRCAPVGSQSPSPPCPPPEK